MLYRKKLHIGLVYSMSYKPTLKTAKLNVIIIIISIVLLLLL